MQHPNGKVCLRHPTLDLLLVNYVDGFKLAGPRANLPQGWKLIGSKINKGASATTWKISRMPAKHRHDEDDAMV